MNFNPMDLVVIKESFYEKNNTLFENITTFINLLIDIQHNPELMKEVETEENKEYLDGFFAKQDMIEFAYKIKKLGEDKNGRNRL